MEPHSLSRNVRIAVIPAKAGIQTIKTMARRAIQSNTPTV
jgi:hypothetical protein